MNLLLIVLIVYLEYTVTILQPVHGMNGMKPKTDLK